MPKSDEETIERAVLSAIKKSKQSYRDLKFKYQNCTEEVILDGTAYFIFECPQNRRLEVYVICANPGSVYLVQDRTKTPVGVMCVTNESEAIDIRGGNWFPNQGYRANNILNIDPATGDTTTAWTIHNGLAPRGMELTEGECLLAGVASMVAMMVRYRDWPE